MDCEKNPFADYALRECVCAEPDKARKAECCYWNGGDSFTDPLEATRYHIILSETATHPRRFRLTCIRAPLKTKVDDRRQPQALL